MTPQASQPMADDRSRRGAGRLASARRTHQRRRTLAGTLAGTVAGRQTPTTTSSRGKLVIRSTFPAPTSMTTRSSIRTPVSPAM